MTSLSQQSVEEMGGTWSVLTRQKRDHVELDGMLRELENAPEEGQPELLNRIYRLVFPHAFAEEALLWPAIRKALPDGEQLTLMVEKEHQEINELVVRLESTPLGDPARRPLIERIIGLLREDVRDEEDTLLPRLQEKLDAAQLRRLGVMWEALRRTAPTRPHPVVARRPPGNALSAAPLSLLDRSRDMLDRVGRRSERLQPSAAGMSDTLGRAAAGVERVGLLRRGERDETRTP
jgi:hypothetical protein